MLFMVIEDFRDPKAIQTRFQERGRMLPDGVTYISSWIDPARARCFQVMDAPNVDALKPWTARWADLVDFEIVSVLESAEYWSQLR